MSIQRTELLVACLTAVSATVGMAGGIPFLNKTANYNLGSEPVVGKVYELDDSLGLITIKGYNRTDAVLTLEITNALVVLGPADQPAGGAGCPVGEPFALMRGRICFLKGRSEIKKREYFLEISWTNESKKRSRWVELHVHKQVNKLD